MSWKGLNSLQQDCGPDPWSLLLDGIPYHSRVEGQGSWLARVLLGRFPRQFHVSRGASKSQYFPMGYEVLRIHRVWFSF